jgi:hypothetical protein
MYSKWLGLSLETRNKIAEIFGIVKKGQIEVFSNTVKVDGYLVQDIEAALTIEAMQKYLGSQHTDRDLLSDMLISKVQAPVVMDAPTPEPEKVLAAGTFTGEIEVMKVKMPVKKAIKKVEVKKVVKKTVKKKCE